MKEWRREGWGRWRGDGGRERRITNGEGREAGGEEGGSKGPRGTWCSL